MNAVVLIIIILIILLFCLKFLTDLQNDPTITVSEWVEMNLEKCKKIFKRKKNNKNGRRKHY